MNFPDPFFHFPDPGVCDDSDDDDGIMDEEEDEGGDEDDDEDDDVEEDEGFEDDLLDCVNVDENIINPPLETDATKSGKR